MNRLGNNIVRHTAVGMWCAIGAMAFLAGCAYFNSPDVKRGDQQLAAGNWEEATLAYKQALKEDPFNPTLQGKYTMARDELRRRMRSEGGPISRNINLTSQRNSLSTHSPLNRPISIINPSCLKHFA